MQEVDVVYLYEHAARELDVACAVKCIAEQHYGLQIRIVQWRHGGSGPQVLSQFRPHVVVLPFCYQEESHNLCLLEWRKSVYFNLAWEQLFYEGNREAKTPRGAFVRNHVFHHAWGDFYVGFLQQRGVPKKHIFLNGNPGYTLYEEPYRQYFEQRGTLAIRHQLDSAKRWLFFPENYNWAFYSEATLNRFILDGQTPDQVFGMRDFCRLSLETVIKWCYEIASHGHVEIILRPRPATPIDEFRCVVQQMIPAITDRMHVIQNGSVREWIMASDCVVSSHSTSLIEAAVAGRSAYMLEPYPIPSSLHMEWHNLVPHIRTESEFLNLWRDGPGGGAHRLGHWARATMMAHGDAVWNVADYLARICRGEIEPPPVPSRKDVTPAGRFPDPTWLSWPLFEYRRIRAKQQRHKLAGRTEPAGEDAGSQPEMERRVNKWKQVLAAHPRLA